jgi:hypothetical protein
MQLGLDPLSGFIVFILNSKSQKTKPQIMLAIGTL